MVYVLVAVVLVCVLVFAVMVTSRRTPSSDDSVADFQRHLNALSPEARRYVMEPLETQENEELDDGA